MPDNVSKEEEDTTRVIPEEELQELRRTFQEARASLIVLAGGEIGREFELTGQPQVIGRSPMVELTFPSNSVSRQHARIALVQAKEGPFYEITDMNSTNGTVVNEEEVQNKRLCDGDQIKLGDIVLKFVTQDTVEAEFHREIQRIMEHDALTGLMKMEAFRRILDYHVAHGCPERPFTLAMTDLDGLKRVNDTYGHLAGRMVVREMGETIRRILRTGDRAALYGGDEAVFLFPETPLSEAMALAERLRNAIAEKRFEHKGNTFGVTISQGLAQWPNHGSTAEELIAAADACLYEAKAAGRNCVRTARI